MKCGIKRCLAVLWLGTTLSVSDAAIGETIVSVDSAASVSRSTPLPHQRSMSSILKELAEVTSTSLSPPLPPTPPGSPGILPTPPLPRLPSAGSDISESSSDSSKTVSIGEYDEEELDVTLVANMLYNSSYPGSSADSTKSNSVSASEHTPSIETEEVLTILLKKARKHVRKSPCYSDVLHCSAGEFSREESNAMTYLKKRWKHMMWCHLPHRLISAVYVLDKFLAGWDETTPEFVDGPCEEYVRAIFKLGAKLEKRWKKGSCNVLHNALQVHKFLRQVDTMFYCPERAAKIGMNLYLVRHGIVPLSALLRTSTITDKELVSVTLEHFRVLVLINTALLFDSLHEADVEECTCPRCVDSEVDLLIEALDWSERYREVSRRWLRQTRSKQTRGTRPCALCETTDSRFVCSDCHKVFYCSILCQRGDWFRHKKVCPKDSVPHETK